MKNLSVIGYVCRTCQRPTNHGVVSHEHDLPDHNYSYIQCLSCDTGAFAVAYSKDEKTPSSNSQRVSDLLPEAGEKTGI